MKSDISSGNIFKFTETKNVIPNKNNNIMEVFKKLMLTKIGIGIKMEIHPVLELVRTSVKK